MINLTGTFEEARFEAELVPHRSIGKRGALAAMGGTGIILGTSTAVIGVMSGGKSLVYTVPFAFAIQMGLTWAFMSNARDAGERQTIKMDESGLTLTHTRPDWNNPLVTQMGPAELPWARIKETEIRGIKKLSLCLRKDEIPLGHFLPPVETENLQKNLKVALRNWINRPTPAT